MILNQARFAIAVLAALSITAATATAETRLLVIAGVGADPDDTARFTSWSAALAGAAAAHGLPAANIVRLGDGNDPNVHGRATRENVTRAFDDLAKQAGADDEIVIVLIGHGSFDGRTAAFNLPGPDLSAADYAKLLDRIPSQHVAFVNTAGASGAFLAPLAGPGRAIVTATATGGEKNDTRFPEYFVAAFSTDAADRDHDGRVSIAEAFEYAKGQVAEAYKKEGLLQTEHATLEDSTGGAFASTLVLGAPAAAASADPALRALEEERRQLELRVAALRQRKDSMTPQQYDAELERLLLELAAKTKAIKERQGKS